MGEDDKVTRVLDLYERFQSGERINKQREAQRYQVNERTIQRDIDSIRRFLANQVVERGVVGDIVYDRMEKGYYLTYECEQDLSGSEVLALCKILLDSRAFPKGKMEHMINRLIEDCALNQNRDMVRRLVANELYHYIELKHGKDVTDTLWQIGQAIQEQRYIEVDYMRTVDKKVVRRKIKPVAIMFSDFYFYLTAFIEDEKVRQNFEVEDDPFPTIYRVDRIEKLQVLDQKFKVLYRDRFQEGEFRKRVQFMYGGKLQRIRFRYFGDSVEAVLDRLPTAKATLEEEGVYTITAEVFGKGIEMWLRSQGEKVEVL